MSAAAISCAQEASYRLIDVLSWAKVRAVHLPRRRRGRHLRQDRRLRRLFFRRGLAPGGPGGGAGFCGSGLSATRRCGRLFPRGGFDRFHSSCFLVKITGGIVVERRLRRGKWWRNGNLPAEPPGRPVQRNAFRTSSKSAGRCASKPSRLPVRGWMKASRCAWSMARGAANPNNSSNRRF